jgi:hypothetical protein
MRRIARYNGTTWAMEDVPANVFLDMALVPVYPDLRGATWVESVVGDEIIFDYQKRAGEKG